ncbi:MAG: translation elongation factor 4 [Chloroflexota bacterium]
MDQSHIRNFCIIAHIDHGKSTLADRLLEMTSTIPKREMQQQVLDRMDLERERGITIKAKAVRMGSHTPNGDEYELNLVDTPGHVDFTYEVSRSLAAVEGAILVVDATQGIQAQTIANVYLALDNHLTVIPVINKIDMPAADPEQTAQELVDTLGFDRNSIIMVSARDGTNVEKVLQAVIERVPPPHGNPEASLRALIFDSKYDPYKGVIAFVRLVDGQVSTTQPLKLMSTGRTAEVLEIGVFTPDMLPVEQLRAGEIGYIATGLKNVTECQVGDTITLSASPASQSLPGYRPAKPMVFAGLYPVDTNDYLPLREALDKLKLNDASLLYEPESSAALGFGFRCGFLGLLHMDIVRERIEREYGLAMIITAPSVAFEVVRTDGTLKTVASPAQLPPPNEIAEIREPIMAITLLVPSRYLGSIMDLASEYSGEYKRMEYLNRAEDHQSSRVLLEYNVPLNAILADFYDQLKSRSQGYASLDYTFIGYRPARLVKLEILVNGQPVDALSSIVRSENAYQEGRALVQRLRQLIPRQLFEVAIQAAVGGRIIARETVAAMRKNVLAKCYGGDITRKRKLLEQQAEGKKRMKAVGRVEIPQEAFMAVLKRE